VILGTNLEWIIYRPAWEFAFCEGWLCPPVAADQDFQVPLHS
jgi:hypothetical protein